MRLVDLVPEPHLRRLVLVPDGDAYPAPTGPLPRVVASFYANGACHYLAEALCQLLGSRQLAVLVHQGEPLHVYAVHAGDAYDAYGRQPLEGAADLLTVSLRDWHERFLDEAGPRGPRFSPLVADSPDLRRCAANAAGLLLASLPDGKAAAGQTLGAAGAGAPILDR